ncbi:MAG: hypothetical protein Q4G02_02095 [bacterium]|nr:hypothetical protein [bacterium]
MKKFFSPVIISLAVIAIAFFSSFAAVQADAETAAQQNDPCIRLPDTENIAKCRKCTYGGETVGAVVGFWTAIGCIPTNPIGAIGQLLTFLMGIGSVLIFAQILVGAFTLMTSKGDPKGVQDAKSRITNSIIALLFILFSVTILQFVGVNILRIPGFFSN